MMKMNSNFNNTKKEISNLRNLINKELDKYLSQKKDYASIIIKAMRYSIFAGGKRLRPLLSLFTAQLLNLKYEKVLPFACAIEMIHTYSLIHDDLPAMDNDDFRRGKLTSHKKFGEAIAILAGDALLNYAFEIMLQFSLKQKNDHKKFLRAIYEIANAAGVKGMISGQVVDIISENKKISKNKLKFLHLHKTATLIRASILSIVKLSNSTDKIKKLLKIFGEKIGLAFQIMDDILSKINGNKKGLLYIADYIVNRIT